MAFAGATLRLIQAGFYALTKKDGIDSAEFHEAMDKMDKAMKRPPLAEGFDFFGEIFD